MRAKNIFIFLYLLLVHVLAAFFIIDKVSRPKAGAQPDAFLINTPDTNTNTAPTISPAATATDYTSTAPQNQLMIPVVGVKRDELQDTYEQSRSGGRVHNAIDIMAPAGRPVVAVADGEIAKFFDSEMGGITIYQWSADKKQVYYYAHLQRRADGIAEKSFVKRGTIIGYVGDSGNAGAGNYHLHFSIIIPKDSASHWEGENINPYPLLKAGIEAPAR